MEWISFTMDNAKKNKFVTELLPSLWKNHGSLLQMSGLTWGTYFSATGTDATLCLFYSESSIFMKSVKAFVGDFERVYSEPDTSALQYFGPENLGN